jgi:hypothetical protein
MPTIHRSIALTYGLAAARCLRHRRARHRGGGLAQSISLSIGFLRAGLPRHAWTVGLQACRHQFPAAEALDGGKLGAGEVFRHADDLHLLAAAGEDETGLSFAANESGDLRARRRLCHDKMIESRCSHER